MVVVEGGGGGVICICEMRLLSRGDNRLVQKATLADKLELRITSSDKAKNYDAINRRRTPAHQMMLIIARPFSRPSFLLLLFSSFFLLFFPSSLLHLLESPVAFFSLFLLFSLYRM